MCGTGKVLLGDFQNFIVGYQKGYVLIKIENNI
jgi:hypothetical protein